MSKRFFFAFVYYCHRINATKLRDLIEINKYERRFYFFIDLIEKEKIFYC